MGKDDEYVKRLLSEVAGRRFIDWGPDLRVRHRDGTYAMIDGVIKDFCAVRIESHGNEQLGGALVDLLSHQLARKLLIIVPTYMRDPIAALKRSASDVGMRNRAPVPLKVVLIKPPDAIENHEADELARNVILGALRELGWRHRHNPEPRGPSKETWKRNVA